MSKAPSCGFEPDSIFSIEDDFQSARIESRRDAATASSHVPSRPPGRAGTFPFHGRSGATWLRLDGSKPTELVPTPCQVQRESTASSQPPWSDTRTSPNHVGPQGRYAPEASRPIRRGLFGCKTKDKMPLLTNGRACRPLRRRAGPRGCCSQPTPAGPWHVLGWRNQMQQRPLPTLYKHLGCLGPIARSAWGACERFAVCRVWRGPQP
jgi:hypothetical protein